MNRTHKIALVLASNVIAFVIGAMTHTHQVVQAAAAPATHEVNGLILSDEQFNAQLAAQKAANDKMDQEYAETLVKEKEHMDAKTDALVQSLAKKAQKDHGLWVPSPVKQTRAL